MASEFPVEKMPLARCTFCTDPPFEEVAVLRWRGENKERLTIPICRKHHERLHKAGDRGREIKGWSYKLGWW